MQKPKVRLLIFIVILTGITGFFFLSNRPSTGTVRVVTKTDSNEKLRDLAPKVYTGKNLSFTFPSSYMVKESQTNTGNFLDRVILLGEGLSSKKIAVTYSPAIANSLSELSAVQSRRLRSDVYTERQVIIGGEPGLQYLKNNTGFELTVLILRKSRLATVSLSANTAGGELITEYESDFRTLLDSWIWL